MDVASKMSKMIEDTISEALIKAVQNLSIEIDEEELLKRLRDSKEIYKRGYEDREQEIVRCKDCKEYQEWNGGKICMRLGSYYGDVPPNWFCADGERAENARLNCSEIPNS